MSARARPARKSAPAPAPAAASRGRWRRLAGWFVAILLALVLLPIGQVLLLRWINPPVTPLMLLRWAEAKFSPRYKGGIDQRWLPRTQVPDEFLRAVWLSEDARFFRHRGFDWIEVAASLERARRKGGAARGSSTITQQCARSTFLWTGRSWIRKGLEAYYTYWMETLLSKQRILEVYVNVIEMGDGIYGIEAAAQRHYHIPASKLSRPQAAMLAALLPYPRGWDPNAPSPKLKWRHKRVLRELRAADNQGTRIRDQG